MKFLLFLIFMTACLNLQAKEIGVYGVTGLTCGKYMTDIDSSSDLKKIYSWWVAGFVTGTNLEKDRILKTDNTAHEAWLKQYCEKNPLDEFMVAVIKLNDELDKRKK